MSEINPENLDGQRPQSPEELAALAHAREQLQVASDFLKEQEKAPQVPKPSFQAYPDSGHAEQADQIIGQPKPEIAVHQEVPGMTMQAEIKTDEGRRKALAELIETKHPIDKAGGANELQEKMQNLLE